MDAQPRSQLFDYSARAFTALTLALSLFFPISPTPVLAQPAGDPPTPDLGVIHAYPESDFIDFQACPLDRTYTLTIDDPANGLGVDYTDTRGPRPADWDPSVGYVDFPLSNFDLKAGDIIEVTDGISIRTHLVTPPGTISVNTITDTASGTLSPGSIVDVYVAPQGIRRVTQADATGLWVVDFSVIGSDPNDPSQAATDLVPGSSGTVFEWDTDSDRTGYAWSLPNPGFNTWNWNTVHGYNWPLGDMVTLTVDDDADPGNGSLYTAVDSAHPAPWDSNSTAVEYYLNNFNIVPGNIVTLSDGLIAKTMTAMDIAVTQVDADFDTVSGTAPAGLNVNVYVHNTNASRNTTTDALGNWSADFSVTGDEDWETQTVDLLPGASGNANAIDVDGDGTGVNWRIPNPYIELNPNGRWAHAREWPIGAEITMMVDDPGNGSGVDFTATATMAQAPWNPDDPNDIVANFNLGSFELRSGQFVTMTNETTSKDIIISDLQITNVDPQADTVSGTAEAFAQLHVWSCNNQYCANRNPVADDTGNWLVNFATPEMNGDQSVFDLVPGSNGGAQQFDADNDYTQVDWRVPNPNFSVWPTDDRVEGWQWPVGATVSLTVDDDADPGNGVLYTDTQVVYIAPWDPSQTYFNFNLWGLVNVQPGQVVTVTDGVTVKAHLVQPLTYDSVDYNTNIGTGTASANVTVQVDIGGPGFNNGYDVTADGDGNWTMDYGAHGVDVTPQNWVNAYIYDDDGDRTQAAPWSGGQPRIDASLEFDWINVSGFTRNGDVTYTIYDYAGGHELFGPITGPLDPYGGGNLNFHHVDLIPGNVITALDVATGTLKSLTIREIKFEVMDTQADLASGFADPNVAVRLNVSERFDYGYSLDTIADGAGNWSVDLGAQGYDVSNYWWVTANLVDEDGDEVVAEAPRIEAEVTTDQLSIHHFSRNQSVTVEIYDVPGGSLIFGPLALPTDRMGEVWLNGRDFNFDLLLGNYIVVTDTAIGYTKELLVEPVTFDELNFNDDYARGLANAGRRMTIHINGPFSHYQLNPVVDVNGNWLADYGNAGYDLTEVMWGTAWVQDGNMDVTYANTTPPPNINASTQYDWINGHNFTPNGQVQVDIYDGSPIGTVSRAFGLAIPASSGALLFSETFIADGNTNLNVNLQEFGFDLQPGYVIVATDLSSAHTTDLTLVPLTFESVDYEANIAYGTAQPGMQVTVYADRPFEHYELTAVTGPDGQWAADFNTLDVDLSDDMWLNVQVYDENGDATQADAPKPPTFSASLGYDNLWGNNWSPNAQVQIELFDTQGGASLAGPFTAYTDAYGNFWIDLWSQGVDLQAGQYVRLTDLATSRTKDTTLINVAFTTIDFDQDIAYGVAPADTRLNIGLGNQFRWDGFDFFSEADGRWVADFGAHLVDLTPDMWGNAQIYDEDGDATQAEWDWKYPHIQAWMVENNVPLHGWPLGVTVTLTVEDPNTVDSPDYTASLPVVAWPPDPRQTTAEFNFGDSLQLRAGMVLTATDGTTTRTHTITALAVTAIDVEADTISGAADPGGWVFVDVWAPNGATRYVQADATGNWVANFAVPGNEGFENSTFDLTTDSNGVARQLDAEANYTAVYWQIPDPLLCLPGTTVTGTVVGPDGMPLTDATLHFDDFNTGEVRFIAHIGGNGAYGCSLPDGDYRIWAEGGGYSREYYDETIFENATPIHVTAGVEYANVNFTLDTPSVIYDHLTFNMTDPVVGDLAVRQAIAYGTDRARIIAATFPYSPMLDTYLPPDHWAHATDGVPQYGFDPQLAGDILTAAGWVDTDGDGVREKDGLRLHIVYVTTDSALRATVSQIFIENMAAIGIEIEVTTQNPWERINAHDFGIAQFGWVVDANDDASIGELFGSDSTNDVGLYNNPVADQLLISAQSVGTRAEKLTYLQQHQALVMADLAALPLFERIESPSAFLTAFPESDAVEGWEWPDGSVVQLTIDDPATEETPDLTREGVMAVTTWGDPRTYIRFDFADEYNLKVGDVVTITDGVMMRTHTVLNLSITTVDEGADTITGQADPGGVVQVWPHEYGEAGTDTVVGANGVWQVDFTGRFNLMAGTAGRSQILDEAGNATAVDWQVPNPLLTAFPENEAVEAWEWPDGSVVSLTIDDPATVQSPDFEQSGTMAVTTWGDPRTYIRFDFWDAYDLKVGDVVTITDGVTTRTHVVLNLAVMFADAETNTLTGVADPGSVVILWPHEFDQVATVQTTAGEDGAWLADFTGRFDLTAGTAGRSQILDEVGNATAVDWQVFWPVLEVWLNNEQLYASNWPLGAILTLTVDDPATPQLPDYTAQEVAGPSLWGRDRLSTAHFDLWNIVDLQPGLIVTVTDGLTTKSMALAQINVTAFDLVSDTIAGTAGPGASVWICACDAALSVFVSRFVTADANGYWAADFADTSGGQPPRDFELGTSGFVSIGDNDGDQTMLDWLISEPPIASAGVDQIADEGSIVTLNGEGSSNTAAYHWDVVEAAGPALTLIGADSATPFFTVFDDGVYTIRLTVLNEAGESASDEVVITVSNVAPTLGVIVAPTAPLAVNSAVAISVPFTDLGVLDTHTAQIDWGNGSVSIGVVNEADGSGTISGSHGYTLSGVYTVGVTVTDDESGASAVEYRYVVVYDPNGGFVTGGGWINSPLGAYAANPTLQGKVHFGFEAKYKKGSIIPIGETEFQLKAGGLKFKSTGYQWLVVSGAKAQVKGSGTIDGAGVYAFMLTVIDGKLTGGADMIRIKIWDSTTGVVLYDNLMGADDFADPATPLGGGSIVIHK